MGIFEFLRRRPVTAVVAVVSVIVIIGLLLDGWEFLTAPLPLPPYIAQVWFTTNWCLSVFAFYLLWRNLKNYEDKWTWQDLAVVRGMLLWLFGASLGYIARAFTDPAITLGTPLGTAGLLLIIQGAIRPPERFAKEGTDGQGPRQDAAGPR